MEPYEPQETTVAWALANEQRHWSPEAIAHIRNEGSLPPDVTGRKSRAVQRTLGGPALQPERQPLDAARVREILEEMAVSGIVPLRFLTPEYPPQLGTIPDPPLVLYAVGSLFDFRRCVAVSGTRKPSPWGRRTAQALGRALAEAGWVVTSGLARGVDTAAHLGALEVPAGATVAVLALPLSEVYPPENVGLAQQVASRGCVLSEHALGQGAGKVEFVRRNRIISGLSLAHVIVESHGSGGTLRQAEYALAQHRPLFVLRPPLSLEAALLGHDRLLKLGAMSVRSIEDVVAKVAGSRSPIRG